MSDIPPRQSPVPVTQRSSPCSVASSTSPEMERDHYREKVEHFKILVRKLQEELHSCKLRKESAETISRMLKESKQDTVNLQKRVNVQDAVIRTLQSRLESHGLSSDVIPHEGEQYVPGQSKQLLDNLTRENTRLRNLIRSKSGDPEEFAKLQQSCEAVERECNELRITISNQQTLINELNEVLRSSDNEKDRSINELREKLNHVTQELSSRDTLCSTLTQESRLLQKQLEDVARQCQELAKRLQEKGHSTDKIVEKALKAASKDGQEGSKTLIDENKLLLQKVREITDMNKRWQEYNNQREAYVKNLMSENNDIKKRLTETQDNQGNHVARETQVEMNQLLDEARRLTRALDEQKHVTAHANSESDRFKRELENANGQIASLRNEIQELNRRLETGGVQDSNEIINALKVQIQICNEDFESERRDRERAQSKLSRLSSEMERVKKENESLRREAARWQQSPRIQTPYNEPLPYYQPSGPHGNFVNQEGLAARGPRHDIDRYNVIDGADNYEDKRIESAKSARYQLNVADSKNNIDDDYVSLNASSISSKEQLSLSPKHSPRNSRDCSPPLSGSPGNTFAKPGDNMLQCPKCQKEFSSDEHPELLEHMESCVY